MLTSKKIMLIDDDVTTCNVLCHFLLNQGFTWVETVNDSRDAVAAVEHSRPDLILLDLMMPHVNGLEIIQQLWEHDLLNHTSVLMLTAMEDEASRKKAILYGATDFVIKPVSSLDLGRRIAQALEPASAVQKEMTDTTRL